MNDEQKSRPPQGSDRAARVGAGGPRPLTSAVAAHRWKTRARLRVLLVALLLLAAVGGLVWFLSVKYRTTPVEPINTQPSPELPAATNSAGTAMPAGSPPASTPQTPEPNTSPSVEPAPSQRAAFSSLQLPLLVPVAGVRPEDLRDTYTQSRAEDRTHDAIDIAAPRGTPVLAAADGRIVNLFNSVPGGITVYQLATDNRTILYYAHLDRYADGLSEGRFARRGEVIGYVGDTGNAGPGNYHLHFSVSLTDDPERWHGGTNVNPYPLLTGKQ